VTWLRILDERCDDVEVNTHLLVLYVAAVFLAMIAPGPDMMFILSTGMRGGARAGLLATLGVVSGEIQLDGGSGAVMVALAGRLALER
jgi:threonine/homoserine/homoserine lactone efflux protein